MVSGSISFMDGLVPYAITYCGLGFGLLNFSTAEPHAVLELRRTIAAAVFVTYGCIPPVLSVIVTHSALLSTPISESARRL